MITKKNLVFLGPPGAGKGTLSMILKEETGLAHISTGDILRAEIKNETELGKKAKECVNKGALVPDEIVAEMVGKRLSESDCENGFILDGFPRTINQADLLNDALQKIGKKLDMVVYFNAEEELLLKRLTARLICKACGYNHNKIFSPPTSEGVCDKCGGELYQRPDDSLETAKDRLKVYNEQTAPLIEYYKEKGLLSEIDSGLSKEDSYPLLISVLK
jgi:adenylate kinase